MSRSNEDLKVINQINQLENEEKKNLHGSYLKGRKKTWSSFTRFIFSVRLPWLFIIIAIALGMISSKVGAIFTNFQREFFSGNLTRETIMKGIGILVFAMIVSIVANFIRDYTTNRISRNIRISLWNKVTRLPMSAYQLIAPRELISRVTQDADLMGTSFVTILVTLLTSSYAVFIYMKQIFDYDQSLAYMQLMIIPFFLILKFIAGRINYNIAVRSRFRFASLTRYMMSILVNIPLIKSYNKEAYERVRGNVAISEYTKLQFKQEAFGIGFDLIDQVFQTINDLVCILYGGYLVANDRLDIGTWIAFYIFSSGIYAMLQVVTNLWPLLKSMQGSLQRIEDVMQLEAEDISIEKAEEIDISNIRLTDVSFSYLDTKVLDNINLEFKKDEMTAIIGKSGSGKTTILSLLLRFYEANDGEILNGETNIIKYPLNAWRKNIAYLQQEAALFDDTIRNNLVYGIDRACTDEELNSVLKEVDLLDTINSMPNGLDTVITEGGNSLSGGEKQRLSIARLLLKQPKIVLIDEATSNLDNISENKVKMAFEKLRKNRIVIIVAHRLSTIKNVDKVVIVEDGKVVEQGKLNDIKAESSFYKNLINAEKGGSHE